MWETFFEPPHVLPPKHAAVFRVAAASLLDALGPDQGDEPLQTDIEVFDNLTAGQKLASLLVATEALLDPDVEPPKVTAILAATVYVIYMELQTLIESEIAFGDHTAVRQLLLIAMGEANHWAVLNDAIPVGEDPVVPIQPDCTDADEWDELIESLRMDVLEDYDFGMAPQFLDMPPEQAAELKNNMNIDDDYFVTIVDDPTPEQLVEIRQELAARLRPS